MEQNILQKNNQTNIIRHKVYPFVHITTILLSESRYICQLKRSIFLLRRVISVLEHINIMQLLHNLHVLRTCNKKLSEHTIETSDLTKHREET